MKIRPASISAPGTPTCYRFTLAIASPGTYSFSGTSTTSQDLGITWANPADHTTQINTSIWTTTFRYIQDTLQMYLSAYTGNTSATVTFSVIGVDSTGADLYTMGTYTLNGGGATILQPQLPNDTTFMASTNPGTPVANGIRCSLGYSVVSQPFTQSASCSVIVPASVVWIGTP